MEVIVAGRDKVVVELTTEEFQGITGVVIGDYYGNRGVAPDAMPGMKFDLSKVIQAIYDLKVVFEVRETIKENLLGMGDRLDRITFPLVSFKETKAELMKGKKK